VPTLGRGSRAVSTFSFRAGIPCSSAAGWAGVHHSEDLTKSTLAQLAWAKTRQHSGVNRTVPAWDCLL